MRTRMSDDAWVCSLAKSSGLREDEARAFWDAVKDNIVSEVGPEGSGSLNIPGFGTFLRITHKGHPLNLGVGPGDRVGDYQVLRFRPAEALREATLGDRTKTYVDSRG